jgi:hypothetical protein
VKVLLVAALLCAAACTKPSSSPQIANGRCSCDNGALCLSRNGAPPSQIVCAPEATAGLGCASFTNAARRCWGSPDLSGLCLCTGDGPMTAAVK